jgi:hypothetical protein
MQTQCEGLQQVRGLLQEMYATCGGKGVSGESGNEQETQPAFFVCLLPNVCLGQQHRGTGGACAERSAVVHVSVQYMW